MQLVPLSFLLRSDEKQFLIGLLQVFWERNLFSMEQLNKGAAEKILRAMSEAGLDLDQLSQATGITRSTLLRRLTGTGNWKLDQLGLIAKAVGCQMVDLVPEIRTAA